MIGVELFSGAGGMSVGATLAGVDIQIAVEIDYFAASTFSHNHKTAKVIQKDIRSIRSIDLNSRSKPIILFGGPPCQGFSKSNLRTRNSKNENNWLFKEYVRLVKQSRPDWIVLENVYGMLGTEGGLFIEQILDSFKKLGYSVTYQVLNAMDYGVPQNRERVFIVGNLHNSEFDFPKPLKSNVISVKEALHDLPDLKNGEKGGVKKYKSSPQYDYAKRLRGSMKESANHNVSLNNEVVVHRYKYIPQGGNWKDIPERHIKNTYTDHSRCHTGIYHRLSEDDPSVVIGNYRKNMLIHPWEDRGLSVREAARLQSFPDWFEFKGFLGNQQQQVGNAVPPLLAKAVFKQILKRV
jgi:DNA (cytosine-5)-methyltransferase 1